MPSRTPPTKKTTTTNNDELAAQLAALKLTRTAEDLDDFLARATKRRWGPRVLLEELARGEIAERERRSLERRESDAVSLDAPVEVVDSHQEAVRSVPRW